ncbi:MAG TPA: hypothetical protein VFE47_29980 [Tepidisphaeraceae bacterium]|jgi:hypothetical protein|nr:hypothetical protein [Tepidisphaeraceae bacterium]
MKAFALIGLLSCAALFTTGCFGDPGYSGSERNDRILRNYNYEGGQIVDDFDENVIMSQPASSLTHWNVQ